MKIERVYREILTSVIEKRNKKFKQLELSRACNLSISTVFHALKPLEKMNAIEKKRFGFLVLDAKKILLYWASIRNLEKEIVYQTYVNKSVNDIESLMPSRCVYTAYSAFKFKFKSLPSEYSEVVVYGKKEDFEKRFGKENLKLKPNLVVLSLDDHLLKFGRVAPIPQIFVDLWNLKSWYAKEFLKKLEEHMHGILE
jgi:predicted transcriptional regulator